MVPGFLIAVLTAVAWGGLDAVRKGLATELRPIPLAALLSAGPLVPLAVWAAVEGGAPSAGWWLPGAASVVANILANVMFVWSLRLSPLSVTVPMLSLTPVFSSLGEALLLGHLPTATQGVGVVLVVAAALALPAASTGLADLRAAWTSEPGVPVMAGVALLWSLSPVLDKAALQHTTIAMHLCILNAAVVGVLVAWLALRGRLGELAEVRRVWRGWGAAVVLMTAATVLQLVAVQLMLVGLIEATKRAIGMAMAAANGALFFDEPLPPMLFPALAAMGVGIMLLV